MCCCTVPGAAGLGPAFVTAMLRRRLDSATPNCRAIARREWPRQPPDVGGGRASAALTASFSCVRRACLVEVVVLGVEDEGGGVGVGVPVAGCDRGSVAVCSTGACCRCRLVALLATASTSSFSSLASSPLSRLLRSMAMLLRCRGVSQAALLLLEHLSHCTCGHTM